MRLFDYASAALLYFGVWMEGGLDSAAPQSPSPVQTPLGTEPLLAANNIMD